MLRFNDPPRRWFAFRLGTTPPAQGDAPSSLLPPVDDERAAHWADAPAEVDDAADKQEPPHRPFGRGR